MRLLDFLIHFDEAMDWPLDDPFLVDDETPVPTWAVAEDLANAAA